MKLYLSSYRIPTPEAVWQLAEQPPEKLSAAVIVNAKDYKTPTERQESIDEVVGDLQQLGLTTNLIDLHNFNSPAELSQSLAANQIIYGCGGNTFILRSLMRQSGFDTVIQELLADKRVYIGESAGAVVAGSSLTGFETMDDRKFLGELPLVEDGLQLIDAVIIPHIDSPKYRDRVAALAAFHTQTTVYQLKDSEALVVHGDETRIVASA